MNDKSPRPMAFNAFAMNTITHMSPGLWRAPGDRTRSYRELSYWQDLARLAEEGCFEALFIADVLGLYDAYQGNDQAAYRSGVQVPVNDPLTIAAIGAAVTEHLGFGITASVFFEHPFPFARRLSTLDHLTGGRIGWNIVTGYLPSANRNLGLREFPHDERYDYADEYMEVIYKLLEGSWEDDAMVLDPASGMVADPRRIHHIGHRGHFFDVPGAHLCEPSPQRTPVLFQAGFSPRGMRFAATHAEVIFISPVTRDYTRQAIARIRSELAAQGRDPHSAKIFVLMTIITDETQALAEAKYRDLQRYVNLEGALVANSGWLGTDLGRFELDAPLTGIDSNAVRSRAEALAGSTTQDGQVWTLRALLQHSGIGGAGPKIVGSPQRVADELQAFVKDTDADGFNLSFATMPGTLQDVVRLVVPELQRRGVYRQEYAPGTLRHKLFGQGDRLPPWHSGAQYRVGGARSTIDDTLGARPA